MSTSKALSDEIKIIPISQNRDNYYNGRRLSEENLTTIFKQLSNNNHPSFIIDAVKTPTNGFSKIQFILGGYYIELTDTNLLKLDNLYVGINITTDLTTNFIYLNIHDDSNSLLDGITFSNNDLSNDYTYTLPLIINKEIPIASKFRFNSNEIENINGGIV